MVAMETMASRFEVAFPDEIDSELFVRFFSAHPGWKESNFQVFGKVLSLLTLFAEKKGFTHEAASLLIPNIIDSTSDLVMIA